MSLKNIDTPCIGICSTIYGDNLCRGCKRTYQEVIDWNIYSEDAKSDIMSRLWLQIVNACCDKIQVLDESILAEQCKKYNIRFSQQQDSRCWAFYLLREGHSKIRSIEKYGIKILAPYDEMSLRDLYQRIDQQILDVNQVTKE